jgi:hypothetical protein
MEIRARSQRAALKRHPWALRVLESRSAPGAATLAQHDAVLGVLFAAGFSYAHAGHAFSLLDSYVYGFVLEEATLPFDASADVGDVVRSILSVMPTGAFPHLVDFAMNHVMKPGYRYADEFEHGLRIVLDGIAAMTARPR